MKTETKTNQFGLTPTQMRKARESTMKILDIATPAEVRVVRAAVMAGEFDGSCYFEAWNDAPVTGKGCGCLIGTIFKQRTDDPDKLRSMFNDFGRWGPSTWTDRVVDHSDKGLNRHIKTWWVNSELTPAEKFIEDTYPGQTPDDNARLAQLVKWIDAWLKKNDKAGE